VLCYSIWDARTDLEEPKSNKDRSQLTLGALLSSGGGGSVVYSPMQVA
jgi:hypothetical protein